jgi:hypothetical protein
MIKNFIRLVLAICIVLLVSVVIPLDTHTAMAQPSTDTLDIPNAVQSKPSTLACPPPLFDYSRAAFYEDINQGGYGLALNCANTGNNYKISNLSDYCMVSIFPEVCNESWNDNISSIWVGSVGCLVGWEHPNYSGNYIKLGPGNHGQVWNDALSSVAWNKNSCNQIAVEGDGELLYYEGKD